jgi:hypothetical protein
MLSWFKKLLGMETHPRDTSPGNLTRRAKNQALQGRYSKEPPMIQAIMAGDKGAVARMLEQGVSHNTKMSDGSANALMVAKACGQTEIVMLLVEHKKALSKKSREVQRQREAEKRANESSQGSIDDRNQSNRQREA